GFAGVLPGAAVVAGLAATEALARVLTAAGVPGLLGGTAALALAGVLPGAAVVAGLAATLALTRVVALTDVLFGFLRGLVLGLVLFVRAQGRAGRQARGNRTQHLREFATLHEGILLGCLPLSVPKEAEPKFLSTP